MENEKGRTFRVTFSENQMGLSLTKQQQLYILVIDNDAVRLRDLKSNDLILEWPYNCVRRYGTSPSKFSVEVGRRSTTGEGLFEMETTESQAILDKIHEVSKELLAKRGSNKPTIPKIVKSENLYTEPYTQLSMKPGENVLKCEPPGGKCEESKTATPCFVTSDGVTVTRIGIDGSKPAEAPRSVPPVSPTLEPPVPPRFEACVPPRLEPRVSSRLEPPLPPRLEPIEQTESEPPVPPRLVPPSKETWSLSAKQNRIESDPGAPTGSDHRAPAGSDPRAPTGSDPRTPTGSETDLYLLPTIMDSVGVSKDDGVGVPPVRTIPTPNTRDDEQGSYWTSTSNEPPNEPPIDHKYERLTISDDDSRRHADPKPAPGKIVVFDLPKRESSKQSRCGYENVKILKR